MYDKEAGILTENSSQNYSFQYLPAYTGEPISLTMPVRHEAYLFNGFPPFFEGLLPEGYNKTQLLKMRKIDSGDYFSQLIYIGEDVVGAVTITEIVAS